MDEIRVGTWVGARRWPNSNGHPNFWGRPWGGKVMDVLNPVAWSHTPNFPVANPDSIAVMNHVQKLRETKVLEGVLPVAWDYGGHRSISWERASNLRSYAEDMAIWNATRAQRLDEIVHPLRRKAKPLIDFLPDNLRYLSQD